uniref:Fibronectin type III and ankyrin repeat domains 1 n=1 Tax=Oryctolagus cuniculus TaxID=9986 RepID=A0A5F9CC28_RABIT
MEPQEISPYSKPHPPVVGKVTHHSIELHWDLEKAARRQGPQEQWFSFSIEEEDPRMHSYGIIYAGYATQHVVEGLEPRTLYRFRLKVTSPSGEFEYSPVVSVSTTGEPISSEYFHRAVNMNDEDLLLRIFQGGHVKVDVPNKFGFTALMVAAQKGYTRLVKILVSNGTDVNLKNGSGKDSLMLACYAGHLDVVKYLRRHGASWEARDLGGCTALHWAADGGHCNVVEWMIKDGCEVDAMDTGLGWTPLMRVSAVSGNQRVASLLIEAGADVNVKDRDGKTPLMVRASASACRGFWKEPWEPWVSALQVLLGASGCHCLCFEDYRQPQFPWAIVGSQQIHQEQRTRCFVLVWASISHVAVTMRGRRFRFRLPLSLQLSLLPRRPQWPGQPCPRRVLLAEPATQEALLLPMLVAEPGWAGVGGWVGGVVPSCCTVLCFLGGRVE